MQHDITEALARTAYTRDLRALIELGEQFRDRLEAFWNAHDSLSVARDLINSGAIAPADVSRALVREPLDEVGDTCDAVNDALETVRAFLSAVRANVLTTPTAGRRECVA